MKFWRDHVKGKWWTNADLTSGTSGKTKTFEIKHAVSGSKPVLNLE